MKSPFNNPDGYVDCFLDKCRTVLNPYVQRCGIRLDDLLTDYEISGRRYQTCAVRRRSPELIADAVCTALPPGNTDGGRDWGNIGRRQNDLHRMSFLHRLNNRVTAVSCSDRERVNSRIRGCSCDKSCRSQIQSGRQSTRDKAENHRRLPAGSLYLI